MVTHMRDLIITGNQPTTKFVNCVIILKLLLSLFSRINFVFNITLIKCTMGYDLFLFEKKRNLLKQFNKIQTSVELRKFHILFSGADPTSIN